jgi:hypothetical protein
MLDEFLKVAYVAELRRQGTAEVEALLVKLPPDELRKLADGTPVATLWPHLEKNAFSDYCEGGVTGSGPKTWLDQFKGTPLLDQALALEQEELQAEMTDMQKRQERRQQNKMDDSLYDMKDQIRMKKRLLELEKVKQEAGGAATVDTPAQGAGAPGPVPAEGVQDSSSGLGGGVAKSASVMDATPAEKVAFAEEMGRQLARHNFEKAAHAELLNIYGAHAGAVMAKLALNLGALGGMAGKALSVAKANPTLAGAAVGGLGGAIAGGPGHRLAGAAGGATVGAGIGHVAGGGGGAMGQKVRDVAGQGISKVKSMFHEPIDLKALQAGGAPPTGGAIPRTTAARPVQHVDLNSIMPPTRADQRNLTPPNVADFARA